MFLTKDEVAELGLKQVGDNVRISSQAQFHNPERISIGANSRIDDFVILSGNVTIGKNVHLSVHSTIISPRESVILEDFSTVSFYTCITSANDDYSGNFMTNPTVPSELTNVVDSPVTLREYAILGAHVLVLPGVTVGKGSAVGAFSLVKKDIPEWEIHAGIPATKIGVRSQQLLSYFHSGRLRMGF